MEPRRIILPPPDEKFPGQPYRVVVDGVKVFLVGYIAEEPNVEVLAGTGEAFFRFVLPKHSRIIRKFWKSIGVIDVSKLPEGAYDSQLGYGPLVLEGMVIGRDTPAEEGSVGALVLEQVALGEWRE